MDELHKNIMNNFPKDECIVLYSMWDGYLQEPGSTLPKFLEGWQWEKLHTSGHTSYQDICRVIDATNAKTVIPMHTEHGEVLLDRFGNEKIYILEDEEIFTVK